MKKICSLVLALLLVLSCLAVNADFNWVTDSVPDLSNATAGNMIYNYSLNPRKSISGNQIDNDARQEIIKLIKEYDFIISDKTMSKEEFGTGNVPKDMILTVLFDTVFVSLLEDCIIFVDRTDLQKVTYCEYSDNSLINKIDELLQPSVKKYEEGQKQEEVKDLGIAVTDFKKIYKASFSTGDDYNENNEEWGLCSYKTDKVHYGAYLYFGDGEFCMISEKLPVSNTFNWDNTVYILNSKLYTDGDDSNLATLKIKLDENYKVTYMEMRYNQYRDMSVIDMSTYKAEGSLKDFANFEFEITKAEEKPVVKEEPEKEEKPDDKKEEVKPVVEEVKKEEKLEVPEQEKPGDTPKENEPSSDWAKGDIEIAKEMGIIDADQDYSYNSAITRKEFCEIVYNYISKVLKLEDISSSMTQITDTDSIAVRQLVYRGIIEGKNIELVSAGAPDTVAVMTKVVTFAPNDYLTREEAATILQRLVNQTGDAPVHEVYYEFDDKEDISDWASAAIQVMCNMGVMKGVGDNKFAPKATYTTEQAIATVVRIYNAFTTRKTIHLNSGMATQLEELVVKNGYGYWTFDIKNNSDSPVKIMITRDTPMGEQVGDMVRAWQNEDVTISCGQTPLSDGVYYLSISTDGYNNFDGSIDITLSDKPE